MGSTMSLELGSTDSLKETLLGLLEVDDVPDRLEVLDRVRMSDSYPSKGETVRYARRP